MTDSGKIHIFQLIAQDRQPLCIIRVSFDALITLRGEHGRVTVNTFKRQIKVDVGWPQTASEWLDLIKKTGENVSWIWVTLLIPIGGGIWALIRRRTWPFKRNESDWS